MKRKINWLAALLLASMLVSANAATSSKLGRPGTGSQTGQTGTLKDLAAARGIRIGCYIQYDIRSVAYDRIFEQEFNAATVGFFWDGVFHQGSNEFLFSETDEGVSFGANRGMDVFGQTLVWFEDIPAWVKAKPLTEIEPLMNENIDTLLKRYAGRIKLWNVVNEAVDADGNIRLDHKWAEAMGTNYIAKAFTRAHAADPKAILYYNEYDIESNEAKYKGVKALLKGLLNKGVRVHALGWQMHVKPASFDPATLLARMNEIADMGLDNYITELDVELPPTPTAADLEAQKQAYKSVVKVFLAARRHKTLMIWGLRDEDPHWLTDNHPLLFDKNFQKKPAYYGIQEALTEQTGPRSDPILMQFTHSVSSQNVATNSFIFVGLRNQRFTLERSRNLIDWTSESTFEFFDDTGVLFYSEEVANAAPFEFFRTKLRR